MKEIFYNLLLNKSYKRKLFVIVFDICCFIATDCIYYLLMRYSHSSAATRNISAFLINSLIQLALMCILKLSSGIYSTVWRYGSPYSYLKMVAADVAACAVTLAVTLLNKTYTGIWRIATVGAITLVLELSARFVYRVIHLHEAPSMGHSGLPTAIIGAGQIGMVLKTYLNADPGSVYDPLFFVDINEEKIGSKVANMPVYGVEKAAEEIKKNNIKNVIIAIPQKDRDLSNVYHHYASLGCNVKIYDSLVTDSTAAAPKVDIRDFTIEDLLFRKPLTVNDEDALAYYNNKTVLITGGGGSIGSELCRQIAKCKPKKLIIFDIYENNAYDIQQELRYEYGSELDLDVCIGSVRDKERLESLFNTYKPDVVFHAAAHKHVPLMEDSSCEAIKNNVIGTYNTANAAEKYGVKKFILISTDKAVNPTNVMGASKRLCEMVIQCRGDSKTSFAAVRFGNVLGSNGSVIPLFRKQIKSGGPVTITDKRIVRYFMTISEASSLVIQAGAMAKQGELFVLDMGRPVKILELAENMIRLSGFEPYKDIDIKEIGLRPGEKLYEELLMKSEKLKKTKNEMIFIEMDEPFTRDAVEEKINILTLASRQMMSGDKYAVHRAIKKTVPTYKDLQDVNRRAAEAEEMKQSVRAV